MAVEPIQPDLCSRPWCQALKYMLGHGKIEISLHVVDNKVEGYEVAWYETKVGKVTQTVVSKTLDAAMNAVVTRVFPT